jgi:hypothetical protein
VVAFAFMQAGFTGLGVGAAFYGLKPIVEFMTFNFAMQVKKPICVAFASFCDSIFGYPNWVNANPVHSKKLRTTGPRGSEEGQYAVFPMNWREVLQGDLMLLGFSV